jgi:formylglycine-generating enzyme required for sulfatase activity
MPGPHAERSRNQRLRKAGLLPPARILTPCSTCPRSCTGRHGEICYICWKKTPEGRKYLAGTAKTVRARKYAREKPKQRKPMIATQANYGFREPLRPSLALHMLWIPPGRFWMGSPASEPERYDDEGPQHEVQLQGFFLARTPISQAQWTVVASWPKVKRELDPDPCFFKGADRPVERVSWNDAMEFCRRLSQRTKRAYTLPSEAQWEYACRAGTTTPFHGGDTLSEELANYNGGEAYGDGLKGKAWGQTTPVGMFPANAWGLQDMHGNVWEWCADHWHDNYEGAPEDGRPWLDENALGCQRRLLRGGSWAALPRGCRSAYRLRGHPDDRLNHWGFRVCCLPQY